MGRCGSMLFTLLKNYPILPIMPPPTIGGLFCYPVDIWVPGGTFGVLVQTFGIIRESVVMKGGRVDDEADSFKNLMLEYICFCQAPFKLAIAVAIELIWPYF